MSNYVRSIHGVLLNGKPAELGGKPVSVPHDTLTSLTRNVLGSNPALHLNGLPPNNLTRSMAKF
jgi:hypothetical protein